MHFLNSLVLLFGGIVPLIVAAKKIRLNRGSFFLGWLSWSCAGTLKIVFLSIIWTIFPFLSKANSVPNIITIISLELLEVVSAYLFLTRHMRLKDIDLNQRIVFALGFGVGEAFTLCIATFLPANVVPSMQLLMSFSERIFLVMIQVGWVMLIADYAATREPINLSLGIFFKAFSSIIALSVPVILFLYDISLERSLYYFEGVLAAYAAIVLLTSLLLHRRISFSGSSTSAFNLRYLFAGIISFLGLGLAISAVIPLLYLTSILPLVTRLLLFVIGTISLIELFSWVRRETALSETALGAFIGILIENSFRLSFVKENLLAQLTVQQILMYPSLNFLAVLLGIALWMLARR